MIALLTYFNSICCFKSLSTGKSDTNYALYRWYKILIESIFTPMGFIKVLKFVYIKLTPFRDHSTLVYIYLVLFTSLVKPKAYYNSPHSRWTTCSSLPQLISADCFIFIEPTILNIRNKSINSTIYYNLAMCQCVCTRFTRIKGKYDIEIFYINIITIIE